MTKSLDLTAVFVSFEGEPIQNGARPFTLKDALLGYLRTASQAGLSAVEDAAAYEVGCLVGTAKGAVELEQGQYDVLKKLVDQNRTRQGQSESPVWGTEVGQQCKRLVDAAESVPEKKAK